jgi:hypothetical protein
MLASELTAAATKNSSWGRQGYACLKPFEIAGRYSVCDLQQIFVLMDVLTKVMDETETVGAQDVAAVVAVLRLLASRIDSMNRT